MPYIASRAYAGDADLQQIITVLSESRPPEGLDDYPGIIDLRELLSLPTIQANTRLWYTDPRRCIAYAIVDSYNNLLFDYLSGHADIQNKIINWGIYCIEQQPRLLDEQLSLDVSCRENDANRITLFTKHGFVPQSTRSLHLFRPLNQPIAQPTLPPGFIIRPTYGREEAEEWVQLHRLAFGTDHMTVDERLAMLDGPDYQSQLDLVAVAPDGSLAAYCVCGISREENLRTGRNEGYTDPLATHPDYQKRGLSRALLLTGLHLLKDQGIETAVMGTNSDNLAMQAVARAVGFVIKSSRIWFSKSV